MAYWEWIRDNVLQIGILLLSTTVLTFGVSGTLTKILLKTGDADG